jgi:hypothetical protein
MILTSRQRGRLFQSLTMYGWRRRGDFLVSPHATFCLPAAATRTSELRELRQAFSDRLLIINATPESTQNHHEEVEDLSAFLEVLRQSIPDI